EALVGFAHAFETLLDHVRTGRIELGEDVVALCIRAVDIVADFVAAARSGAVLPPDYGREERLRFEALSNADAAGADDAPMDEFDIDFTPVAVNLEAGEAEDIEAASGGWRIGFQPFPALYERANDPL